MANQRLIALLESGNFDWDNIAHRQMFLKDWSKGDEELRALGWIAADSEGSPADSEGTYGDL